MTQGTASSVAGESPREACAPGSRLILGSRRFWLVLMAVAVVAGAAFNWGWLVAVGVAPLLLTLLPCAAMCALAPLREQRRRWQLHGGTSGGVRSCAVKLDRPTKAA
jgi:hypothetical protein